MLIITFQAIWGTMHGHGPFLAQTPAENATALQLFLLVTATPLMLLAVVIEEERRTEHALRQSYEQNQDLGGRLIDAQEDERARIARDLHDDLSQQLAGVAIIVSGLKRKVGKPGIESEVEQTFATLQERTAAAGMLSYIGRSHLYVFFSNHVFQYMQGFDCFVFSSFKPGTIWCT